MLGDRTRCPVAARAPRDGASQRRCATPGVLRYLIGAQARASPSGCEEVDSRTRERRGRRALARAVTSPVHVGASVDRVGLLKLDDGCLVLIREVLGEDDADDDELVALFLAPVEAAALDAQLRV